MSEPAGWEFVFTVRPDRFAYADRGSAAALHGELVDLLNEHGYVANAEMRERPVSALDCYACREPVGPGDLRCPACGNVVRCEVPGCPAPMDEVKCPNDKSRCLDHCGEDHS